MCSQKQVLRMWYQSKKSIQPFLSTTFFRFWPADSRILNKGDIWIRFKCTSHNGVKLHESLLWGSSLWILGTNWLKGLYGLHWTGDSITESPPSPSDLHHPLPSITPPLHHSSPSRSLKHSHLSLTHITPHFHISQNIPSHSPSPPLPPPVPVRR